MNTALRHIYFTYFLCLIGNVPIQLFGQNLQLADIPFEQDGEALAFPFAGGMGAPQFSEIDLNGDDKLDLFIFDRVDEVVTTYIYDETSETGYIYAPEYKDNFPVLNDWAFIRDYNGDNIPDIFTSDNLPTFFGIQVYQGSIEAGGLSFTLIELNKGPENLIYFTDENNNILELEVLPSDLPSIEDIDGDGDLDILDFDGAGGVVEFMRNLSVENGYGLDSLIYERADRCWGKFFEAGTSDASILLSSDPDECYTSIIGDVVQERHAGSSITTFDHNSNGLYDIFIGDVSNDNLIHLTNTGSADQAYMTDMDTHFPSNTTSVDLFTFPASYFIDVNHDGLQDMIASPNEYLRAENRNMNLLYLNEGTLSDPIFSFQSNDFLVKDMIDVSSASRPAIIDYNADGLLDIVIGTYGELGENNVPFGQLFLYENIGSVTSPSYRLVDEDYLDFRRFGEMNFYLTPTFGDLDGDGDQDLLMGNLTGRLIYFENSAGVGNPVDFGSPQFNYQGIDIGNHASPSIGDMDNDGLMDLVIGEENGNNNESGTEKCSHFTYYRNIGTVGNPVFDSVLESENNISCFGKVRLDNSNSDTKGFGSPQLIELDGEILLLTGSKSGDIKLYKDLRSNINSSFELVYESFSPINLGDRTHPLLWDLNDDGELELIVGSLRGGLQIYHTGLRLDQLLTSTQIVHLLDFDISPNPVHSRLNVFGELSRSTFYQIYSMEGQLIQVDRLNETQEIPVSSLPNGIYTIRIFNGDKYGVRKFIKY